MLFRSVSAVTRQAATLQQRQALGVARNAAFVSAFQQQTSWLSTSSSNSSGGRVGEGSHADFQKQTKSASHHSHSHGGHGHSHNEKGECVDDTTEIFDVQQWLGQVVKEHPVLLFMKGSPNSPKCGFSASVVNVLNDVGCEFASADILENEDVRSGLKVFSKWPTFPQLYIGGEFVGGADIVNELNKSGQLKPMLQKVGAVKN